MPVLFVYHPGTFGLVPNALSHIDVDSGIPIKVSPTNYTEFLVITLFTTILVVPLFLSRVSWAQFNASDLAMAHYIVLVLSSNPSVQITIFSGVNPLVHILGSVEQVVLPASQGFCRLIMGNCHTSALFGHIFAINIVNLLYQHVWWSKLPTIVIFYKQCKFYTKIKEQTAMSPGVLKPLPIPPK